MAVQTTNPYLEGPFAPVAEEVTATDLAVVGALPPELDGRYLRIGPNPMEGTVGDPAAHHWFTGDGMVHGIRLRDGRAEWYRNRWVRSTRVSTLLGEEPAPGERHGAMDTVNTNIIGHAGTTLALVEAGARPVELTEELATVRHTDLGGTLPNGFTAHPKRDPLTGELHAVAYHWSVPHLQYIVVGTDGRVRKVVEVPVDDGPMVHDMSLTERFAVVYDLPVTFDLESAASGASFPYAWAPGRAARLGVLPREGTAADIRWFEVEPCYVFHPLNAYDEPGADGGEGRMVLHVIRHERTFDADRSGPADVTPTLWRWTVDLDRGTVTEEQLDDRAQEFPRVAESRVGRPARYGWAAELGFTGPGDFGAGSNIIRHDLAAGTVDRHPAGASRQVGEAVAIARDGAPADAEDDAWIMSLAHDRDTDRGELVVWAADAPGAEPVARVPLPARVPFGFHGSWIPTAR
ncbi:carotenoid oxygenase family protein [Iamia sp.]|uniref:carotenoid oxygenase family protein n=1 Tax=Iamia sp. TaxID=2722710 RepID=UPI002BCCE660|nr:carotenoid oxygenase family protein [Iamia sp.]HXH59435.1 carotenoid oxygenase family protein [Iamia sp.]